MSRFSKLYLMLLCTTLSAASLATVNIDCDCDEDFAGTRTMILPRSQSLNSAILNLNPWIYGCENNVCDMCGIFSLGYRFSQTYKDERIVKELFVSKTLKFTGSLVSGRTPEKGDIMADYFGLDPLYMGRIKFEPRIQNHQIDFSARWELKDWHEYLSCAYFGINATLVHANWNLKAKVLENDEGSLRVVEDCTVTSLPDQNRSGYMRNATTNTTPVKFSNDLQEALSGDFTFGDMKEAWSYGKFSFDKKGLTTTKLANIDFILGNDFVRTDDYHLGLFVKAVAPTGTKLDEKFARYKFNPIVGNGHHWELGGGLNAHWDLWQCDSQCVTVYLDGSITHLFKDKQWRTFDLKSMKNGASLGSNSAYVLLKEYNYDGKNYTYKSLLNAVDYATRQIESYFSVQGDATLRLQYQNCGWLLGLGYNIYGRTKEKFADDCKFKRNIDNKHFALKGMTGVAYRDTTDSKWKILNSSQTDFSNINGAFDIDGTYVQVSDYSNNTNCKTKQNIDNPSINASNTYTWDGVINARINSTPKIIDPSIIDFEQGKLPRQLIHKIFGQIGYRWEEYCDWEPFISIYGDCDFASSCETQSPVMWTIGIQGGIAF